VKICFVSIGPDFAGFPRANKEITSLSKLGYEMVFLCKNRLDMPKLEKRGNLIIKRIEGKLIDLVLKMPSIFFLVKSLVVFFYFFAASLKEKADIYHCYGFNSLLPTYFSALLLRRLIIYEGIEDYPWAFSYYVFNKTKSKFLSDLTWKTVFKIESSLIRNVSFVFTIDSADGIPFKRYLRFNSRVTILQNVPEVDFFNRTDELIYQKYRGWNVIIYIGAVHKIRGCLNAIKAIRYVRMKVPNVKLVLIGEVRDDTYVEGIKYAKENCYLENIEFTGFVPYKKLASYLKISKVALWIYLPYIQSLRTKGSSKLFLYMGAGLPIVASDFLGIRSIIKEAKCGLLVNPLNIEEIAEAIIFLLNNPDVAKRLGNNGKRAFIEKYNWAREEEKIINIYRNTIKKIYGN